MRVATWNVNGLRARLAFVKHWLECRQPDVVALQETKLTDEQFPFAELEEAGYHGVSFGQKGWNGVAVLSREPLDVTQRGLPGAQDMGARLITATVAGLSVSSLYCPNGKDLDHPDFPRKLSWFEALRRHLDEAHDSGAAILLGGDFNVCPAPIDSWNEELLGGRIFHTEEERRLLRTLFDWGLQDLYRQRYPETQAFSWWDYRAGAFHKKQGLRIDLLLATPAVAERVKEVVIDREYRKKKDGLTASDHAPVMADLAL